MKQFTHILILLIISLTTVWGAAPPWEFTEGDDKLFLFIPKDGIRLEDKTVTENIYIGVFYAEGNTSHCAGYIQWKNDTTNLVVHGYTNTNKKPSSGTALEFRIWDAEKNCVLRQVMVYAPNWDQTFTGQLTKINIDSLVGRTKNRVYYTETIHLENNSFYTPEIFGVNDSLVFSTEQKDSLVLNPYTGEIDLKLSQPGNYTIQYQSETCLLNHESKVTLIEKEQEYILSPQSNNPEYHQLYFKETGDLKVVNINGRIVKKLYGPTFWDGSSDNGSILPNGEYYLISEQDQKTITLIR